ncbi:hypothetical protein B0H12DRAFT_688603 [Mycena haematopus]|nr:hypothetical protein B0H12DRAFT_688603 [Mycena haematopus]
MRSLPSTALVGQRTPVLALRFAFSPVLVSNLLAAAPTNYPGPKTMINLLEWIESYLSSLSLRGHELLRFGGRGWRGQIPLIYLLTRSYGVVFSGV